MLMGKVVVRSTLLRDRYSLALPDARKRSSAESVQGSRLPEYDRNENEQGAKNLPGVEPLVEHQPAQQGSGYRVEQRQKGDRKCRQSLQAPRPDDVRHNPADYHE